jgi:hypothetical protein
MKPTNLYLSNNCTTDEFKEKELKVLSWISSKDFKDFLDKNDGKQFEICNSGLNLRFEKQPYRYVNVYNEKAYVGWLYIGGPASISRELSNSLFWKSFVNLIQFDEES